MLLVQYLREKLGKTGTVVGCDTSNCGACTIHLDGTSVKSCNVLAVQADGGDVTTIEGLAQDGELHPMQEAFRECHGLQCGYCTPGMIMQSVDLLKENPPPPRRRSARGSRATSAAAPATTTSSRPCSRRPAATRERSMTATGRTGATGPGTEIGRDRRRKEDQRLITGRTRWTDNLTPPGTLYLAMVRSPFAHATITNIDAAAAKAAPNVVGVLTAADLGETQGVLHQRLADHPRAGDPDPPADRLGRVAFAGEIVAVVVARTQAEARDAAELVDVDYDVLPAVIGLKEAAGRGARAPRPRHQQVGAVGLRLRARPAPAAASTRPSRRPAATASSSSASTASSG